ncbi:DUF4097 family beta strand repeat-containing protein (plasmid) [Kitasatospora sp. NBC_00374]|uniref:DUF4097 family beta strand repeat-containing protein n=1 Tax=Kitasatospora sp. NBC_00374 TaxID=2975964 RepID=UPI002F916059
MPTTNSFTAETDGPIRFQIGITHGTVKVTSNSAVTRATVSVRTEDNNGEAAEAVTAASAIQANRTLQVTVPATENATTSAVYFGGGNTVVNSVIHGTVDTVNGATFVQRDSGNVHIAGSVRDMHIGRSRTGKRTIVADGQVLVGHGPSGGRSGHIQVDVQLPPGSEIAFTSDGGAHLELDGNYRRVEATTVNGDVEGRDSDIGTATIRTTSGDVTLDRLRQGGLLKSVNGDLKIREYAGATLTISTVNGDIKVTAADRTTPGDVTLKTVNGDITTKRVRGNPYLRLSVGTVHGDINHR